MKISAPVRAAPRAPVRRVPAGRSGATASPTVSTSAFATLGLQPTLLVGAVNDPMEREAEVNAERVASGGTARVAGVDAASPAPVSLLGARRQAVRREGLGGQPGLDELDQAPPIPENQKEIEVPAEADVKPEGLDAADMSEVKSGEPSGGGDGDGGSEAAPAEPPPEVPVQTDRAGMTPVAVGRDGGPAPADVAARVASPGAGRRLPGDVRATMERGFGVDFGHVRIHDATHDRHDAARLGARAFTHGRHIWLGPDESISDRKLIAHELTHVMQQTGHRRSRGAPAGQRATLRAVAPIRRAGWLAEKAESYARYIPGYTLLCVILGKSPITGDSVPRTAENLVGGFMGLVPGGTILFEQLEEAHVIQDAFNWVSEKLSELDLSWGRIERTIDRAIDLFSITSPIESIKPAFAPLFDDIATFAIALKDKIIELIIKGALKLAGPYAEQVWEIINSARDTFKLILDDPLAFAKNLLSAVVKGFGQFGSNILDHLKRGLMGWLFGAIEGADIKLPAKLDLKGLLSIGFQLLGLTWERIRKKIVKKLDPNGEMKVSFIEKAIDVIRILVTEGFTGIWQRILDYIESFKTTVIEGIKGFVMSSIVKAGLSWLAGLSNPVGAIIKLAMAIYDVITVFLERLQQILDVAKSLFASVGAIAKGNIGDAANRVEETIGRTVPVVISFIAGLLNLGGISGKIREIIKKLRAPVDKALDKLMTFLIKKAKQLLSKIIAKLNKKRKLPSASFTFGKRQHRIFAKKKGKKVELMIASENEKPVPEHEEQAKKEAKKPDDAQANAAGGEVVKEIDDADKEAGADAKKIDPDSMKENQRSGMDGLDAELKEAAAALEAKGKKIDEFPQFDTENAPYLFRAKEPRFVDIEGEAGSYQTRGEETKKPILVAGKPDPQGKTYSVYYENDHVPEKQYAHAILDNIDKFKPGASGGGLDRATDKTAAPPTQKDAGKPAVGKLGASIVKLDDNAKEFPAISLYRPVHILKESTKPAEATSKVLEAAKASGKPGPVAAIKNVIRTEIQSESNRIASIVRQDKTAVPAVKAKVDAGLQKIAELGREMYGLDDTVKAEAANQQPDPTKPESALSEVPFTGDGAKKPDFTQIEGVYQAYSNFDAGFGQYMEYDHVIEKAWPFHAKDLTFGYPELKQKVKDGLKGAGVDPQAPGVDSRLASLGKKNMFSARQRISSYDGKSGEAIALYRPIHRALTQDSRIKPPKSAAPIVAGISDGFVKPMVDYIATGDLAHLEAARKQAQDDIRKTFENATSTHTDVIAEQYAHELRNAEVVNPGRKDDAKQAMLKITSKVRQSLLDARKTMKDLF